ncbi:MULTISPECIES: hypothetical protein [Paenibacillus sonchi group]|uniref:DUF1232 domain-containing protein n=2 Tax=Paenibacillus riograndensis TaxID=483937 RepID=A0A132U0F7_9BACL|nr:MULTISPECIES: hypothetical protein [Paenibacillus sonchi group]KWX76843.1 hypothetical protein AMQ84_14320 [Paenibacillus riograndensis]MCE3200260.1 hypothetical protein [Paenibacillus sonchi]CQR54919.1 hypothetical protein PRIO_2514 [Paenibacillus riograndensis SBR5]
MKLKKLLSLKQWSHIFRNSWQFVISPQVAMADKLLFTIPVILYWVLPDFMPFLPIDDIGVTMLLTGWFVSRMERKYPALRTGR